MSNFTTHKTMKDLHLLPFNREVEYRDDLVKKLSEFGFHGTITLIETDLIDGVMRKYIADGQHRAHTAQILNMEFYSALTPYTFTHVNDSSTSRYF